MKRTNKKGFTIVELVVVIAIIAILAAVLIPTFSSLIKRANISKDNQLVRNLNTALIADAAINGKHNDMQSALDAVADAGFLVDRINKASAKDNEILWDQVNDVFCYLNDGKVEYIPSSVEAEKQLLKDDYRLWKIYDSVPDPADQTYSIYLAGTAVTGEFTVKVGIDVGSNSGIAKINYTGTTPKTDVRIRTNGGTLTVNAPADTVNHYGDADKVDVQAVANASYHENGTVQLIAVKEGHVKLEGNADVNGVYVYTDNASAGFENIKITVDAGVEIPTLSRSAVVVQDGGTKVCTVVTDQAKDIYLFNEGIYEQIKAIDHIDSADYQTESAYNTAVSTALAASAWVDESGSGASANTQTAAQQLANEWTGSVAPVWDTNDSTRELEDITNKEEALGVSSTATSEEIAAAIGAKVEESGVPIEEAYEANIFKGKGTAEEPYLISNGRDLINLIKFINSETRENVNISITKDIDFTTDISLEDKVWIPIGNKIHKFNGTINGNGHKIIGLSNQGKTFSDITNDANYLELYTSASDSTGWAYYGFIGFAENVTINDLHFIGSRIAVDNNNHVDFDKAGIVAGQIEGNSYFKNVTVDSTSTITGADKISGFVGQIEGSGTHIFKNCTVEGTITATEGDNPRAGGFIAQARWNEKIHFDNCTFAGSVTAKNSDNVGWAGGFISHLNINSQSNRAEGISFENCSSKDTTLTGSLSGAWIAANDYSSKVTFDNCKKNGTEVTSYSSDLLSYRTKDADNSLLGINGKLYLVNEYEKSTPWDKLDEVNFVDLHIDYEYDENYFLTMTVNSCGDSEAAFDTELRFSQNVITDENYKIVGAENGVKLHILSISNYTLTFSGANNNFYNNDGTLMAANEASIYGSRTFTWDSTLGTAGGWRCIANN